MNTSLLIILSLVLIIGCAAFFVLRRRSDDSTVGAKRLSDEFVSVSAPKKLEDLGYDLTLADENGVTLLRTREIERMPARSQSIGASGDGIERVRHLAADLFKGVASIPNRTVEVVFKPEIHKGLADGTYSLMKTKTGEVLADAVNANGKLVGKARLIQGGKARQLAGGAFQLVSIAVAQSHLADIEKSLGTIKDSIVEILERQENEDKSRITGAHDYLAEIARHMKDLRGPDELSQPKMNTIESIIKDSHIWRNKLEEDLMSLNKQVSSLTDSDNFGTGDTFNKLKGLIERAGPLLARRELLLNLSAALAFVTAYLDPGHRQYSRISMNDETWTKLLNDFKSGVLEKEAELMGKSFWNLNETLQLRKDKLRSMASDYHRTGGDQQANYLKLRASLNESMARLIDEGGNVRIAISFDERGEVSGAALV